MTVGKPISRILISDEKYQSTVQKLIEHDWLGTNDNDVFPTEHGEILMIGLITRLWMVHEFPEYDKPRIDAMHATALYKRLNDMGLLNILEYNGAELCCLSDEGVQWCIKLLTEEDNRGNFDEMMDFSEEKKIKSMSINMLNNEGKNKRRGFRK